LLLRKERSSVKKIEPIIATKRSKEARIRKSEKKEYKGKIEIISDKKNTKLIKLFKK